MSTCIRKTQKKYLSRDSPAFSAQDCKGLKKMGNDGNYWISKKGSSSVYRWQPMNKTTKTTKTKTKKAKKAKKAKKTKKAKKAKKTQKNTKGKLLLEDIQKMAKKYDMRPVGNKKDLAERILLMRDTLPKDHKLALTDKDKLKLVEFLYGETNETETKSNKGTGLFNFF
jgi:hypothetical protein